MSTFTLSIMKAFVLTLVCITTLLLTFVLLPDTLTASDLSIRTLPNQLYGWLCDNWSYLALAASEVAAFLPSKAKGIVQASLRIGSLIFKKKKNERSEN